MTTDSSTLRYLNAVLELDPNHEAAAILSHREHFHAGTQPPAMKAVPSAPTVKRPAAVTAEPEPVQSRETLRAELDQLRKEFWKSNPKTFESKAVELELAAYPDLREARNRLLRVNQLRQDFVDLMSARGVDHEFIRRFQKIAVASSRDATAMKEKMLASMRKSSHLKARQTIKTLRRRFSGLYDLEPDWLESMVETQRRSVRRKAEPAYSSSSTGEDSSGWSTVFMVFILIKAFVLAMRAFSSD